MSIVEIKVPDIGGHENVDIIAVEVKAGDTIAVDDTLITLETDKATMDVPADAAGVVKEVKVKVGDKISEGGVILTVETGAAAAHEKKKPINEEQAAYITKQLNEIMRRIDVNLNFQYHKEINVMSVRMLDKKTGELLREIPAESLVEHMIKVRDWLGAFLDKTA